MSYNDIDSPDYNDTNIGPGHGYETPEEKEITRLEKLLARANEEMAYLRLQRDALLEMTWLDLPSEPNESTKRWREQFEAGWTRKDAALAAGSEGA